MFTLGSKKATRHAAQGTYEAFKFIKKKLYQLLGLDRKSFKFHSLPVPTQYYTKPYIDDYNVSSFYTSQFTLKKDYRFMSLSLFTIFFAISYFLTSLTLDQDIAYYYYTNYPIPMKYHDKLLHLWSQFDSQYLQFLNVGDIKEKYQVNLYLEENREKVFKTKQKQEEKDRFAVELREQLMRVDTQIKEIDREGKEAMR